MWIMIIIKMVLFTWNYNSVKHFVIWFIKHMCLAEGISGWTLHLCFLLRSSGGSDFLSCFVNWAKSYPLFSSRQSSLMYERPISCLIYLMIYLNDYSIPWFHSQSILIYFKMLLMYLHLALALLRVCFKVKCNLNTCLNFSLSYFSVWLKYHYSSKESLQIPHSLLSWFWFSSEHLSFIVHLASSKFCITYIYCT